VTARAMSSSRYNSAAGRREMRRRQDEQLANARAQTPSQSASFSTPQQTGFGFGSSAPAVGGNNSTNGGMFGGGSSAFGGGATSSFPPAQSAAPSNTFSSSSFPAFGANSQSAGFNPQPPSANGFNFTAATGGNPFANAPNGASMNGSTPAAFGSGSMFTSQPPSNPFGGLAQNSTTTATASGGLFGTSSAAPSTNMFGTAAPSSTPAPAATPFTFGAASSSAQTTASTPAPSNLFSGFGASTSAAPAQNSLFSGFGATAQNGVGAQQETPQKSMFTMGTSAQGTGNATATAPPASMFNFASAAQQNNGTTSTAPPPNMFGGLSTPSSAPTGNLFGKLAPAPAPSAAPALPAFSFGQQPQAQEKTPAGNPFGAIKLPEENASTPKPSLFSSIKAPQPTPSAPSETPKSNLFASLAKPAAAATPSGFTSTSDASQHMQPAPVFSPNYGTTASDAGPSSSSNMFSNFEEPKAGLFSAAPPKTSSGLFSQPPLPETNSNDAFKPSSTFGGFKPQSTSAESSKAAAPQSACTSDLSNPFAKSSVPATERPNLFAPAKAQAPAPAPSPMPALTGGASSAEPSGPELPKIPKAHVPKEWTGLSAAGIVNTDNLFRLISNLTVQLQQLNEKYRAKLNGLSPSADWSALSLWHNQHSSAIKMKIDIAKKQRAAANGVTGSESALSTKRKVNDESSEGRDASPTKRARPAEALTTPTPDSAPQFNPTATSSMFAKAINNKPSAPAASINMFAPKTTPASAPEPSKPAAAAMGFQPSYPVAAASDAQNAFSSFKANAASTSAAPPTFKPVTSGSSGGFASQFAAKAKTYEQLAAERKKKEMEEDYDSDDETKEEWSARYDKREAERLAKEKAAVAASSGFSLPAFGATPAAAKPEAASKPADASKPASGLSLPPFTGFTPTPAAAPSAPTPANPFANLPKPSSGASTPGLFNSRPASPALSNTGSVFDAPSTAHTPSSNIFGHVSSGASSNNQEESDEEDGTTPPKRKSIEVSDSDENAKRQKPTTTSKGNLLSRMSRSEEDGSESEKENSTPIFGANGSSTPATKPLHFFDFGAAGSNTAPPKSDTFGGDQTFKHTTPIKFGAATEKKSAPTFQFQAPSASTTPSKPPPTSLFNFGPSAGAGPSLLAPSSVSSSTFNSRAATPLSDAGDSAASAAEDEDEDGNQVDLSKLTPEEKDSNDVVFETDLALAKHQVEKEWVKFARGPLYILKDKTTGKCFVRIRIPSGQTPMNYSILPALKASVSGTSGKMVQVTMPKKEGGFETVYVYLRTKEVAAEFEERYNASLPA
jgi:hypothetical protein